MTSIVATPSSTRRVTRAPTNPPCAVVWINGRQAVVGGMDTAGRIHLRTVERTSENEASYLELVIRTIGDRERVIILGPGSARLALERAYVAIYHRPERLVDVEPAGPFDADELVERLRQLAA
jgi:hypothetical protein